MRVRSFISHFKRALLFAAAVFAIICIMNYLYVDDTDEFARTMMHEFYEQEENIDRVYLGSSHVFCGVDPAILDQINGDHNFDLASGNQQLIGSYYLLREADRRHHIKHAYIDLYYDCTTEGTGNLHDYYAIPYSWNILDNMKLSFNKLSYMINLSGPRYYYLSVFAFTRYKEKLFRPDYVAELVQKKRTQTWKNYDYYHAGRMEDRELVMKNAGMGFMTSLGTPETGGFFDRKSEDALKEDPMTEESLDYLVKIIDYCREKHIALTWIVCPISDYQLAGNGAYDCYTEQIKELSKEYDVPCYDFNLCKKEYLDLSSNQYWFDKGHLNSSGAEVFTRFLGEFLQAEENGENTYADCFHDSYGEKLSAAGEKIYGIEILDSDEYDKCLPDVTPDKREGYAVYQIHPVTNAQEGKVEIHACFVPLKEENPDIWPGASVLSANRSGAASAIGEPEPGSGVPEFGRMTYEADEELEIMYDGNDGYVILNKEEQGTLYIEAKIRTSSQTDNWARIRLE